MVPIESFRQYFVGNVPSLAQDGTRSHSSSFSTPFSPLKWQGKRELTSYIIHMDQSVVPPQYAADSSTWHSSILQSVAAASPRYQGSPKHIPEQERLCQHPLPFRAPRAPPHARLRVVYPDRSVLEATMRFFYFFVFLCFSY